MTEIPASLIAFQRRFPDADAGTLLHRTRLSLTIRFRAACLMTTHCNGNAPGHLRLATITVLQRQGSRQFRCAQQHRHDRGRQDRRLERLQRGASGPPPAPCHRRQTAHETLALIHTAFCNLKGLGTGRLPRAACQAPPDLSRRVRLSLQPAPKSPRCIPVPVPADSARQTSPLPHLDQTGTKCISSLRIYNMSKKSCMS